jgi:hypothetical protein
MTRAQEMFFKHHPAVYQKALYERLLRSEQYKTKTDAEKQQLLQKQLADISGLLARYRETGAGPSGSAKLATGFGGGGRTGAGRGGGGGGGGTSGDYLDFIEGMTGNEINRGKAGLDSQLLVEQQMERIERTPVQFAAFQQQFLAEEDRLYRQGRTSLGDLPAKLVSQFTANAERLAGDLERATPYQARRAAADFYMQLRRRNPQIFGVPGEPLTPDAQVVLSVLDDTYGTEGFLLNTLMTGKEPLFEIEKERQRVYRDMQSAAGVAVQPFESRGRELLGGMSLSEKDTNKDGKVSADEEAAAMKRATEQARKELGIAEPLTDEEALLISRYTGLLEDDGIITEQEKQAFGADFEAARAAFEKGRRVENLPRGAQPFYDQTYLDLLEERAGLRGQLGQLEGMEGTPEQRAARATLGLPTIDAAALDAASAAAGTPLAGETMPFAVARYNKGGGQINPESPAERVAQRIIDANQGAIPFLDFVAAVNKRYPKDELARRDALAYYGAFGYANQSKMQTLDVAKAAAAIGEKETPEAAAQALSAAAQREGGRGVGGSFEDLAISRAGMSGQGVDASINFFGQPPSLPLPGAQALAPMGRFQLENMPSPFAPVAPLGPVRAAEMGISAEYMRNPGPVGRNEFLGRASSMGPMTAAAVAPVTFSESRLPVSAYGSSFQQQVRGALGPMPTSERQLSADEIDRIELDQLIREERQRRELERELLLRDLVEQQRLELEARGNLPR